MILARFIVVVAFGFLAACRTQPAAAPIQTLPALELYERICSSCHGMRGKGDGPVASLIKTGVPDLTRLAARDGGEFPTEDVRRTIDGRCEVDSWLPLAPSVGVLWRY